MIKNSYKKALMALTVSAIFGTMAVSASAADLSASGSTAYLQIIDGYVSEYGTAEITDIYSGMDSGLAYSNLVDFSGDGVPELHLLYLTGELQSDGNAYMCPLILTEEIWTWNGTNAECLMQTTHYSDETTHGHSGGGRDIVTSDNGTTYLYSEGINQYVGTVRLCTESMYVKDYSGNTVDSLVFKIGKPETEQAMSDEDAQYSITRNENIIESGTYSEFVSKYGEYYHISDGSTESFNLSKHSEGIVFKDFYNVDAKISLVEAGAYIALSWQTGSCENALNNIINSEIKVRYNDETLSFDQPPIIEDGRTLVPVRTIFEAMGAEVYWDGDTQTVTGIRGDTTITLVIDSAVAMINDETYILDVPAKTLSGRTLVPVRFIAEAMDCNVDWDGETNTVIIGS